MKHETSLVPQPPSNMSHNVFSHDLVESIPENDTLLWWANRYLNLEVKGVQSNHTFDAKRRDLVRFFEWYQQSNGHLRIEEWLPRDTQGFLQFLEQEGRAPATVNRVFSTLRRFARWVHEQEDTPFKLGLPTRGVKERAVEEPDAQKLDRTVIHALLKAADRLVLTENRKNSRPRRNRAIFSLLLYTGLRPSELIELKREQYEGNYLLRVKRKGNAYQDLYVQKAAREFLDDYLNEEWIHDVDNDSDRLFTAFGGNALNRRDINRIIEKIAQEANKHRREEDKMTVYPYQLRHTFASIYREKTQSDVETAKRLGHVSGTKYVGRYGKKTKAEQETELEEMNF